MKRLVIILCISSMHLSLNCIASEQSNVANSSINSNHIKEKTLGYDSNIGQVDVDDFRLNHELGFRYGSPSKKQIYDIYTTELFHRYNFGRIENTLMLWSFETSVEKIKVSDMKAINWGYGFNYKIPILGLQDVHFVAHTKGHYLTKHYFNRKRYGGPLHWSFAIGGDYKLSDNIDLSYMWRHMSNGDRYEYNPNLETHTFSAIIKF